MQDSELIHGLKNGHPEAFRKLIELHQVPLIRLCKGFLVREEDARDIVQETFIEVFESISRFREDARLSTWIYRIAVNKSINLKHKNKFRQFFLSLDAFSGGRKHDDLIPLPDNTLEQPGFALENREKALQIRRAMDTLPDNQRIAFILNKFQDLSYKEIAEVMDISLASVESLIHRAKINLQQKLFALYKKNLL
jgi:RNA polymerase sigma-70 factor (ECF subfamily)